MHGTNKQSFLMSLKTWKNWQYPLLCTLEDKVLKTLTIDLPEDVCSKTKFHSAVELQNVWHHHHSYVIFFTSYIKVVDNFSSYFFFLFVSHWCEMHFVDLRISGDIYRVVEWVYTAPLCFTLTISDQKDREC